jgi:hypothetical protein
MTLASSLLVGQQEGGYAYENWMFDQEVDMSLS